MIGLVFAIVGVFVNFKAKEDASKVLWGVFIAIGIVTGILVGVSLFNLLGIDDTVTYYYVQGAVPFSQTWMFGAIVLYLLISNVITYAIDFLGSKELYGIRYKIDKKSKTAMVIESLKATGDVIIQSEIEGASVTTIGKEAFKHRRISSIEIPNSISYIGEDAFVGCQCSKCIEIPDSVTAIANSAFLLASLTVKYKEKIYHIEINEYGFADMPKEFYGSVSRW